MARNKAFRPERDPFADIEQVSKSVVHGPLSFLNPTIAHLELELEEHAPEPWSSENEITKEKAQPESHARFLWRSRDNRKGRHPLLVTKDDAGEVITPRPTSHSSEVLKTVSKMFTHYPIWDISWQIAYIFTWGSIVWCINGFFAFLPFVRPSANFKGEVLDGGGITAFVGACLFFEIGSILLMFEAVNENRTGCFGWAVEKLIEEESGRGRLQLQPNLEHCTHHHPNKKNLFGKSAVSDKSNTRSTDELRDNGKTWQWFPTRNALKTHYFHELGFIASFSQFCGATIFSIAGITALPGINNNMSQPLADGIYWAPQIIGGSGFIISGTLYMLETQKNWYTPAFHVLGWHIAFWNLIGGIGFTLCGALGPVAGNHGAQYQAALSTFWGSFTFLIGSVLQLYESLQKHPVEVEKGA
ncbi:hypothetical protein LTR70_000949 [Exophiala xenobiotica]|uniref:Integral membrane protein n=1 Tax=Lithohypha guttulata TaxID=1690604 RepID=A0ABR0KK10_9EURO|nr:hypothetical protein LTR24_001560 [Lithohypha guttulata]KAK5329113.1 hypothetical protein LTR70_000949 [Exophiala xenobiotica]